MDRQTQTTLPHDLAGFGKPVRWFPFGLQMFGGVALFAAIALLANYQSSVHEILAALAAMTGVGCFVSAEIIRLLAEIAERKS